MRDIDAVRRARWATAAIFLVNGTIVGTWAAHIPLVEARLSISHATLGIALLVMAAGALIAMPLTGSGIARFGSAALTRWSTLALFLAFPLPLIAPAPALLMPALFLFGAANGVMDVSMNAHGVMVERRLERAIMSSLHGMWSLGGLAGAGFAALVLPLLPPLAEALTMLAAGGVGAIMALRFLLPSSDDGGNGKVSFAWPSRATFALGALCFLCMASEGAVLDWSALHLKASLSLGPGLAATGFAAFSAAMAASRFGGDSLRARFGSVALVRWSALLAAAGMTLSLTVPSPLLAVAGFALVGLGLANLVPVFFGAAGRTPGKGAGSAIAAVATVGYSGFLLGPPVIGVIADLSSLAWALGLIVLACLAIAVSAGRVRAD
ncbi:MAG: MFS transporter [Propylenella sp.]